MGAAFETVPVLAQCRATSCARRHPSNAGTALPTHARTQGRRRHEHLDNVNDGTDWHVAELCRVNVALCPRHELLRDDPWGVR